MIRPILLLLLSTHTVAATLTIALTPPTTREDGSKLDGPLSYDIYANDCSNTALQHAGSLTTNSGEIEINDAKIDQLLISCCKILGIIF